jgi:lipopolysaccharide export system permease protein
LVIDRYILRETLYTLAAVLAILLVIFISNRFVRYLADVGTGGVEARTVLYVLGLKTLGALVIILPLGLFIAILLSFSRLYKDSEMVALAACGVSVQRIYRSVVGLALLVAVLVAAVSFVFAPWSEEESYRLRDEQQARASLSGVVPGRFTDLGSGGTVYFQRLARDGAMEKIFARQQTRTGPVMLTAERGYVRTAEDGRQVAVFEDGYRYEGTPGKGTFRIIRFAEHRLRLEQRQVRPSFRKQRALPTVALLSSDKPADSAELQWRASMPLSVLVLSLLAVPISRTTPRQGKYARLFVAVLIYLIYNNLLGIANGWVARGLLPPAIGMWWVHLVMLAGVWLLFVRQYGLRWILGGALRRTATP